MMSSHTANLDLGDKHLLFITVYLKYMCNSNLLGRAFLGCSSPALLSWCGEIFG